MRKTVRVILFLPFYLLALLLFISSCEHKELWRENYDTYRVNVAYDWSGITSHDMPSAMRVLFYPLDDDERTEPYIFDFVGHDGGTVSLPAGHYNVVSFNHDTDNIIINGTDNSDTMAALTQRMSANSSSVNIPDSLLPQDAPLYDSPQWFCRAYKSEVYVEPTAETLTTRSGSVGSQTVTLAPEWAVYKINYTIKGVNGLKYVTHAEGYLSGMASQLGVMSNKPGGMSCMVPFTATASEADSLMHGTVFVWGTMSAETHNFGIFIWGQDKNYYTVADVSSQLATLSDSEGSRTNEINITVTVDVSFSPKSNGGGFSPTVDDYKEIHTTIPIK